MKIPEAAALSCVLLKSLLYHPNCNPLSMKYEAKQHFVFDSLALFVCILAVSFSVYSYIEKQNELTELRRGIPVLEREVKAILEENRRLRYEIDRFESPLHLMELARKPEYSHLRFPCLNEVILLHDGEGG